jgi:hypothetical protein
MQAIFTYQATRTTCAGVADASGVASCTPRAVPTAGALTSVNACFGHQGQLYCAEAI